MEKLRDEKNISKEKGDGLVCERELCSRCEERPQRGLGTRTEGRDQDRARGEEQPKVCKAGIKDHQGNTGRGWHSKGDIKD